MNRTTRALVDELVRAYPFPDPRRADRRGLLAYGGDLEPERLLAAYAQGVFPWYDEAPILWHSPDPRMVLLPGELHVGRSLEKTIRAKPFVLTMDRAFGEVIRACSAAPRPGQGGTWIGPDMIAAYEGLHALGFAHSVEAWESRSADALDRAKAEDAATALDDSGNPLHLVGGLYGVSLGRAFFGESMFAHAADASKVAFVEFVRQVERWGFDFVDCQVRTEHLARFGAREWRRGTFLEALERALEGETRRGAWEFELDTVRTGEPRQGSDG
jgi:leucyl/phenylalanyl-tRNA---protein transferase